MATGLRKCILICQKPKRSFVIVIIDNKKMTWEEAYKEVKQGTEPGKIIIDKLTSQDIIITLRRGE